MGLRQSLSGLQSRAHSSIWCLEGSHTLTPTQHAEEGLAADFGPLLSKEIAFIEFADVPLISDGGEVRRHLTRRWGETQKSLHSLT